MSRISDQLIQASHQLYTVVVQKEKVLRYRSVHDVITIYAVNVKYTACFTARRYASAVFAVVVCLSVRPSVYLSVTSG